MLLWNTVASLLGSGLAASVQSPIKETVKDYGLPLTAWGFLSSTQVYYTATIGLGTPAQLSRAAVDLQWAGGYVDSQFCSPLPVDPNPEVYLLYNHTQSSTYRENGTNATTWWTLRPFQVGEVEGCLSYDTLSLGDQLQVPDYLFIENSAMCGSWGYAEHDSILGLSPSPRPQYLNELSANVSIPGAFETYVEMNKHKKIEGKNFFSMLAPYYGEYEGVISFGTIDDDLFEGDLVKHKLYPEDAQSWSIKAPTIKLRDLNGTTIFEQPIPDRVAYIDSTMPGLLLPESLGIVQKIIHGLGTPSEPGCHTPAVDCKKRASLPYVILDFDGQEIVLTGEDYFSLTEALFCFRPKCEIQIVEPNWPLVDIDGNDIIILGTDFLKMVYAVFDWDDKSISFAQANRNVLPTTQRTLDVGDRWLRQREDAIKRGIDVDEEGFPRSIIGQRPYMAKNRGQVKQGA